MNHEKYSDRTAEMAMKAAERGSPRLTAKAIYTKFMSLPVSEKYVIKKYKSGGPGGGNSIILTTDSNLQLRFTITRKGWMLEAI